MDHQKPTISLIFGTLSLGGCGGHPMRPKLNLKDKSQMSTPNEYTDNFKSNSTCIFLSVRTKLKKTLCPRTRCIMILFRNNPLFKLQLRILLVMTQNIHLSMTVWIIFGSILKCIILMMLVKPVSRMIVS